MPAIVRLGDNCSGCCAPPAPANQGDSSVLVNGKAVNCVGHSWTPHACPKSPPHGRSTASGSSKTLVKGRGVARIGDSISCGAACAQGSPNTFSN